MLKAGDIILFRVIKRYPITAAGAAVDFHPHPAKASIAARLAQAHKLGNLVRLEDVDRLLQPTEERRKAYDQAAKEAGLAA
ncbi:hypothetical protein LTR10_011496 [Elasticomyces elasticus]|uniref:Uncharacterized protein n=1 Tax=Exophiala sideris TaxID=1016849 RepID=A0ABR0JCN3_9EURO|nr:hypothetical protein LTR10_011496 [Elasticomyces elasticus]KAK5032048.1 hypothetical protein LTS07_004670 [Exophiala sideris]KAK5040976.1 hypothetical protein LTR13_003278 [Exophiala sideris]KAK5061690.1 hypothetical protein LTR69_004872 [Exophiala sideris]KAK5184390.1 hypothetical protein LTR44_003063 [Eurotiomycetes sp. CCFEE 6388]